ncbi:MAG: BrnT family toxin [Deltaproteobacteria bacterium]|nr:BrnT family toxin [Deltaproteobacteria bacterium]
MKFIWDPDKAAINFKKHKISFELASSIFDDPFHLSIIDKHSYSEVRWISVGRSLDRKTLVVIHTDRIEVNEGEYIRIISARKATLKEKKQYEEGI